MKHFFFFLVKIITRNTNRGYSFQVTNTKNGTNFYAKNMTKENASNACFVLFRFSSPTHFLEDRIETLVVKMDSRAIDFFFHGVYLSCRIGKTRRRKVRSQVGQRTRVRPRMYMVGYEMERFCGHSRGNSIRHTKSSAQDAPRNSTLSLNSASLKLAWLDILFSFFFFYVASFNQII